MKWIPKEPRRKPPTKIIGNLLHINDSIDKNIETFTRMVFWALKDTDPDSMSSKLRFAEKQLRRLNDPLYRWRSIVVGKFMRAVEKLEDFSPTLIKARLLYLFGIDTEKAIEEFERCLREKKSKEQSLPSQAPTKEPS